MMDDLFTEGEVLPPVAKNGNAPATQDVGETSSTALALLAGDFTPLAVVQQPETRKAFYDHVKAQFDAYVPDMTTDKGRKAFASMAYRANTAKADIERAANQLTEEWRQKTDQVIQARKEAVGEIEKLRLAFIKPLDDWKQAEKDRAYQEQIAAEKRRADEAEAQRKADAERIERERQAEAKRIEDERLAKEKTEREARAAEEKCQADQSHRSRVMKAAKEALMEHADIAEDVAKRVVIAITGNNIPAVAITF